jgi:hypothetical protein
MKLNLLKDKRKCHLNQVFKDKHKVCQLNQECKEHKAELKCQLLQQLKEHRELQPLYLQHRVDRPFNKK